MNYKVSYGNSRVLFYSVIFIFLMIFSNSIGQNWTTLETSGAMDVREEAAFMSCKGKFYLMGGLGQMPVNIFDPQTGTWTRGAIPPVEMHHFQAVRLGEEIYVVGALTGTFPLERPLEHIYIYNTGNDTWRKGDPLPKNRLRGSAGVSVYRGMIYLICGRQEQFGEKETNWLDRYDPKTGQWKKLSNAPRIRDYFHASIINGKIYAAGGRKTSNFVSGIEDSNIAEVDVYDIKSGRWETLPESQNLPTTRAGCATVVLMDQLLIIGGESISYDDAHNLVEVYDVESGKWERWDNLKEGRHGTQAFMCVGSVFIASGSSAREGGAELASIEMLNY